jgi:D-arabinose 1-dehydrogenase-like Zn-dependent alcohol dehydrogenase
MGTPEDFKEMMAFVGEHQLKPVIDKEFTLDQAVDALMYLKNEHQMGKVIVNI